MPPVIDVLESFKIAPDGNHVIEIPVGLQDVSDRTAEVAIEQLKVAQYPAPPAPPAPDTKPKKVKANESGTNPTDVAAGSGEAESQGG